MVRSGNVKQNFGKLKSAGMRMPRRLTSSTSTSCLMIAIALTLTIVVAKEGERQLQGHRAPAVERCQPGIKALHTNARYQ